MEVMNNSEIKIKVKNSVDSQINKTGYAMPVQVLTDLNILSKKDYENWRFGKVGYLEKVCKINLSKLSLIMREIKTYCKFLNLKPSETYYKQWGLKDKRKKIRLRFSKNNNEEIEKNYATHYLNLSKINQLKLENSKINEQS